MFGWFKSEGRGDYWRNAYEELVRQTGRDLNDGYGRCKCRPVPSAASSPTTPIKA